MATGWTARTTAALVVAAALLSGCSEQQPANETLPQTTAEPSQTAEALPPLGPPDLPMPPEARTQDAEGAEAFVRYYVALINRTSTIMDAAPMREFSDECADCDRIAADTEEDAAAGYRYRGGELTITWIQALEPDSDAEVAFLADQAALSVLDAAGQPVPELTFEAVDQVSSGASLRWDSELASWLITELTLG
ncbi:DUF6318 family protein [Trujillonella humicola]|uniref:DUF6318 family protein n=1 Tax=Trujillonella humicola TaxID=3383699 RepID=UPI003906592E